jgi:hypothetical protein
MDDVVWRLTAEPMRRMIFDMLVADCPPERLRDLRVTPEGVEMLRWLLTTDDDPLPIDA